MLADELATASGKNESRRSDRRTPINLNHHR
jgi:hypothetical protein